MPVNSKKTKAQLLNEVRKYQERVEELEGTVAQHTKLEAELSSTVSQLEEEISERKRTEEVLGGSEKSPLRQLTELEQV